MMVASEADDGLVAADFQAVDVLAQVIGVMDGPAREPQDLLLEFAQNVEFDALSCFFVFTYWRGPAYGVQRWLGELALAHQAGDLPTGSHQKSVHTEGQRQTQAAGHLDLAGSGLHDSSDAGAGTDLRSRPSTRAVCLPSRAQRPTGGGRGGSGC